MRMRCKAAHSSHTKVLVPLLSMTRVEWYTCNLNHQLTMLGVAFALSRGVRSATAILVVKLYMLHQHWLLE